MTITLATTKGAPLSVAEADANVSTLDARTALGWRDNVIEMSMRGGPNDPSITPFIGNLYLLGFGTDRQYEVFGNFHIDHDYALGTKLYPHIHWSADTTTVGTVRWGIEYTVAKGHQQQAFNAPVTVYVEQTTTGTPYMHYVAEVSDADAVDGAALGVEPDTIIMVRVFRDASHANDTYPDVAFGIFLDMHYQADRATTPFKRPDFLTGA